MAQQPFTTIHKYKPVPVEAPVLAVSAPPPLSNQVCACSSDTQGLRAGPVITFEYAGELKYQLVYSLVSAGASWFEMCDLACGSAASMQQDRHSVSLSVSKAESPRNVVDTVTHVLPPV